MVMVILRFTVGVTSAADTCSRDTEDVDCGQEAFVDLVDDEDTLDTAVDQFKKEGWAVVKGVLDKQFMEEVRSHVDYLLDKYPQIPGGEDVLLLI